MKKVILINRPLNRPHKKFHVSRRKWQPLNLLYIGTYLTNKNIPVEIIDARAEDYSVQTIEKILLSKRPQTVLIASDPFDFYQCPNPTLASFYETIKVIKQASVKNIISIGPQATIFDKKLLEKTSLNYIIKGDDPITAAKLIINLVNNKQQIDYPNISYKDKRGIHIGSIQHLKNLDELPIGNYGLLPMKKYKANIREFPASSFSIISTSRGCPFRCKYCFKNMIGSQVRYMSLDRIKKELDVLVHKNNIKTIYFIDDYFTFNYDHIFKLCDMIIKNKYNIKWGCQTRTDRVSLGLLKKMKAASCIYISYGIESGSQQIVDQALKNLKLDQAEEIIKLTKRVGIFPHANMMYGFPNETKDDFKQSIDFMIRNQEYELPGAIRFYPGSKFYEELIPGKTIKQVEEISSNLSLSKLKTAHVERGLAKLVLFKKIKYKEYDWHFFYFMLKYLFPSLIKKIKKQF